MRRTRRLFRRSPGRDLCQSRPQRMMVLELRGCEPKHAHMANRASHKLRCYPTCSCVRETAVEGSISACHDTAHVRVCLRQHSVIEHYGVTAERPERSADFVAAASFPSKLENALPGGIMARCTAPGLLWRVASVLACTVAVSAAPSTPYQVR